MKVSDSLVFLTPNNLTKKRKVVFSSDLSNSMAFIELQILNLLRSLKKFVLVEPYPATQLHTAAHSLTPGGREERIRKVEVRRLVG